MKIRIIGAALVGSETAYQLVKRGFEIELYEIKTKTKNPVQNLNTFAELVCSNSLWVTLLETAIGTLKVELKFF